MDESKAKVSRDGEAAPPERRRSLEEFNRDAVRLVVEEEYAFKAAGRRRFQSE